MKPSRIAVPARGITQQFAGPQEFIQGFIQGLLDYTSFEVFVYHNAPEAKGLFPGAQERYLPGKNRFLWDQGILPRALVRDGIQWVIYPKGTMSFMLPKSIRSSIVIYDLGYFYPHLHAYRLTDTLYMRYAMRFSARRAWSIFTVSEATRRDVLHRFHIPPNRVVTIYGAPHPRYRRVTDVERLTQVRRRYRLWEPFIFYPTSISPRKNIARVLEAFRGLLGRIPHHLYFTGGLRWNTRAILREMQALGDRVHLLGSVSPEDMPVLYSLADACIYPSLFEGFGLPIVEAFRCEVPVLTSNLTSMPEVAGDAALIVDAYDVQSIREGIYRLVTDQALRTRLVRAGRLRAQAFSWKRTVTILQQWVEQHW